MIAIYVITNVRNGKVYIGSTRDAKKRWQDHVSALRRGKSHNRLLQCDWDIYGEGSFTYAVLEELSDESSRFEREQYYMDVYIAYNPDSGYNISPTAEKTLGRRHTRESREKMSRTHTGKKLSDEHRRKIADSMRGYRKSDEHQRKITESLRRFRKQPKDDRTSGPASNEGVTN